MLNFDPRRLRPAEHVEEPETVLQGWRAADLDDSELVDDDFIINDPDSTAADDVDPDHEIWPDEVDD